MHIMLFCQLKLKLLNKKKRHMVFFVLPYTIKNIIMLLVLFVFFIFCDIINLLKIFSIIILNKFIKIVHKGEIWLY